MVNLRMDLSRKIFASPLRRLEELGAPRLLATLTSDVADITSILIFVPRLAINAAAVVGGAFYMAWLSWSAFFVILSFITLGIIIYRVVIRKAMCAQRVARETYDALFKHIRGLTEGIKELKLHRERRQAFLNQNLRPTIEVLRRHITASRTFYIASENLTRFIFFAILGLFIFALPNLKEITAETLTGYALTTLYLYRPIGVVTYLLPFFSQAAVALRKIEDLGLSLASRSTEVRSSEFGGAESSPPVHRSSEFGVRSGKAICNLQSAIPLHWERLELAGVTHTYHREKEDGDFKLGPIDMAFSPGELVFLIGGNGSGKTTLAKIITGLYPPETGEIRLNGKSIADENRDDYRQFFSAVFSDFYLFESLLGLESASLDAQALEYLVQLQLNHKVKVQDGALSTTDLSHGQRKRLALLTAYLEDRPFYVFDEWASDQDALFKKIFYTQLLPGLKARGKTILVISHDDRYFHLADRCIKMEDGKLQIEEEEDGPAHRTTHT
jgi:putative ATP-binding cassette transporter